MVWVAQSVRQGRGKGPEAAWAGGFGTCICSNARQVKRRWVGRNAARRTKEPFDLAAGLLIVRAAGGDVIDLNGNAVSPIEHSGVFIAGTDRAYLRELATIIRAAAAIDG